MVLSPAKSGRLETALIINHKKTMYMQQIHVGLHCRSLNPGLFNSFITTSTYIEARQSWRLGRKWLCIPELLALLKPRLSPASELLTGCHEDGSAFKESTTRW